MFQFTRPRGARLPSASWTSRSRAFQFTRPRGARLPVHLFPLPKTRFNSRAHGGRDSAAALEDVDPKFQFTRPRGARLSYVKTLMTASTFQFTRPRGARPMPTTWTAGRRAFQFTRPRGARLLTYLKSIILRSMFQFTRPRGARPTEKELNIQAKDVSIHAPTGGATRPTRCRRPQRCRFNSRAHGGRDHLRLAAARRQDVSIHAPTGGATWNITQISVPRGFNSRAHGGRDTDTLVVKPRVQQVSIHAPTGGATRTTERGQLGRRGFNSRAHGGRDEKNPMSITSNIVSIHAPTGGATSCSAPAPRVPPRFQFTRPRGARHPIFQPHPSLQQFQFTRPRGARPTPPCGARTQSGFNSRAHGGRDVRRLYPRRRGVVSIHAPTGGATYGE